MENSPKDLQALCMALAEAEQVANRFAIQMHREALRAERNLEQLSRELEHLSHAMDHSEAGGRTDSLEVPKLPQNV